MSLHIHDSVESLEHDLAEVTRQLALIGKELHVKFAFTDDSKLCIEVWAPEDHRAYIPKNYNGYDVVFTAWDNASIFNIDTPVKIGHLQERVYGTFLS